MSSLCEVPNQPEMVHSLLTVLGTRDQSDVSRTLLGMSTSPDTCAAMRSSGCLPLMIRLLYAPDSSQDMKTHVALALRNIVKANPDDELSRLEGRILSLLENVRDYSNILLNNKSIVTYGSDNETRDKNAGLTVATLLRLSFDSKQRRAMCQLGGLHAIAQLLQVVHQVSGGSEENIHCLMLKRYAAMALTNLTCGESSNKSLLCSLKQFVHALVAQLNCSSEELQQATASVVRNLSWRPDDTSKQVLRETGAVLVLMKTAMKVKKESTLETLLSALWNLSSHCNLNKVEICAVDGALRFLVLSLTYKAPSGKSTVIEFAGCILRNISSHIAEREDCRSILRDQDCLQILTRHLTSSNSTIVGNACITLWKLSADCPEDQYTLWMLGAPNLLRNLIHSKHKLTALGSSAALKNLLAARPESESLHCSYRDFAQDGLTGEQKRRSRSIEDELDEVLSETRLKKELSVSSTTASGRRDDKFVFSLTEVDKKNQRSHLRTFHKTQPHVMSRSRSKERSSTILQECINDMGRLDVSDKKTVTNLDKMQFPEATKSRIESSSLTKQPSKQSKSEYSALEDGSFSDLSHENEAISTVDELLEVVKDMASLRISGDSANHVDKSVLRISPKDEMCEKQLKSSDSATRFGSSQSELVCGDEAPGNVVVVTSSDNRSGVGESLESKPVREDGTCHNELRSDVMLRDHPSLESCAKPAQSDNTCRDSDGVVVTSNDNQSTLVESLKPEPVQKDESNNNQQRVDIVLLSEDEQSSSHPNCTKSNPAENNETHHDEPGNCEEIPSKADSFTHQDPVELKLVQAEEIASDAVIAPDDVIVVETRSAPNVETCHGNDSARSKNVESKEVNNDKFRNDLIQSRSDAGRGQDRIEGDHFRDEGTAELGSDKLATRRDRAEDNSVHTEIKENWEWIDVSDVTCVDGALVKTGKIQRTPEGSSFVENTADKVVRDGKEEKPCLVSLASKKSPQRSLEELPTTGKDVKEVEAEAITSTKEQAEQVIEETLCAESTATEKVKDEQICNGLPKDEPLLSPGKRSLEDLSYVEVASAEALKEEALGFNSEYTFEDTDEEESTQYAIEYSSVDKDAETPSENIPNEIHPDRASSSPEAYGDYAETDLDQPTDYSLQYGEEDELTDDDDLHPSGKRDPGFYVTAVPISVHEDTVKTYCTEGTPFETPYNFSTATSMSDLRAEPSIKEEIEEGSESVAVSRKDVPAALLAGGAVKVETVRENGALLLGEDLHLDSGLLSPADKPVRFCEEGTPGQCLSRFSSLSSLCGDLSLGERNQPKGSVSRGSNGGNEHAFAELTARPQSVNAILDKFVSTRKNENIGSETVPSDSSVVRPSFFEDVVVSFKEESTPVNFSCATSLSSLSFDDEPRISMESPLKRESATQKNSSQVAGSVTSPSVPGSENGQCSEDVMLNNACLVSPRSRRRDSLSSKPPTQGSSGLKPNVPSITSRRVVKQENGRILPTSSASNAEDQGACEDSTYNFCTEGTPANISHAGSHSDLLMLAIANHREDKFQGACDKNSVIDESSDDNLSFSDDCENILAECIKSGMPKTSTSLSESKPRNDVQKIKTESDDSADNMREFEKSHEDNNCQQGETSKHDEVEDKGKVVTFDNADHYAEETPLMFSRTSSLASLSSFDQQSIVDDRSSVISDFSRLTSGAVSPSEIPDSPSQLVSASPHRPKPPDFRGADAGNVKTSFSGLAQTSSHQSFSKPGPSCVFEDDVEPFKVEDTPVEFSRATSLSSLSICDDANAEDEGAGCLPKGTSEAEKASPPKAEIQDEKDKSDDKNSINLESEEEDDDAILAACISIGMQETRKNPVVNPQMYNNYRGLDHFSSHLSQPNHPGLHSVKSGSSPSAKTKLQSCNIAKVPNHVAEAGHQAQAVCAFDDVTYRYCTEDTPANISHAGSLSDLSVLSFRSGEDEAQGEDIGQTRRTTELSDDLFSVSDHEGMLAECIQAGMPKKSSSKRRNNSLSLNPDREASRSSSPRAYSRDERFAHEPFHDRSRASTSSQQVSPVTAKSKMMSRPTSSASSASMNYGGPRNSSHPRKARRATYAMPETRHVEHHGAFDDSTHRFCTEDTPASISHAGSNSDISVLSIPDDDKEEHHELPRRQGSFLNLSDDSLDNSDCENILAECIQSGMPKAKPIAKPTSRAAHPVPVASHVMQPCPAEQVVNAPRRSAPPAPAPAPAHQMRLGSRMTARITRNMGFVRRVFAQADRPPPPPVQMPLSIPTPVLPQHFFGDGAANRNAVPTGMWQTSASQKVPTGREMPKRMPACYPNNNSYNYDASWEMDASVLKDSQALRSMLQNQQNVRAWRKLRSTSPSNRWFPDVLPPGNPYAKENGNNALPTNGDFNSAPLKAAPAPLANAASLPPNIRPLDRQRTFTKLEPTLLAHLPSPPSSTRIPVPAQTPTKLPNPKKSNPEPVAKSRLKSKSSTGTSQLKKLPDQNKPSDLKPSNGFMSSASRLSGKSATVKSASSASSASSLVFRQNTAERRSFKLSSRPAGLEDKRSNSFSSIASSASSKSSVRPFKREVTSKVASLWKKTDTSSDDSQSRPNVSRTDVTSRDSKSNGVESSRRTPVTRKMVRSATFEGLPRNVDLAKAHKVKDDSQIRSANAPSAPADRFAKKTTHKNRNSSEKREEQLGKTKAQAPNAETSRNDVCTSVIERRNQSLKPGCVKSDQHSVRVTKV